MSQENGVLKVDPTEALGAILSESEHIDTSILAIFDGFNAILGGEKGLAYLESQALAVRQSQMELYESIADSQKHLGHLSTTSAKWRRLLAERGDPGGHNIKQFLDNRIAETFADLREARNNLSRVHTSAAGVRQDMKRLGSVAASLGNVSNITTALQLGSALTTRDLNTVGEMSVSSLAGASSQRLLPWLLRLMAPRAALLWSAGFVGVGVGVVAFLVAPAIWRYIQGEGHSIASSVLDRFGGAQTWEPRRDPLILDLDGDGIETVGANGYHGALFDHTGNGVAQASGWVARDDGLLVLDRDGNGRIDSGRELFGDNTVLASGELAEDGFEALSDLDDNQDGVVDAADAAYSDLRVWRDINQDGVSQEGELESLDQLDIAALNTGARETSEDLGNGNLLTDVGSFVRSDGTVQGMGDVDFASSPFYRHFQGIVEITDRAAGLPDMAGSGMVRDLREAASLSEALAATLEAYAAADTRSVQHQLLDELLHRWASTSEMPSYAQEALASGVLVDYRFGEVSYQAAATDRSPVTVTEDGEVGDAVWQAHNEGQSADYVRWLERMEVLERFVGTTFARSGLPAFSGGPSHEILIEDAEGTQHLERFQLHSVEIAGGQLDLLDRSYGALRDSVYQGLLAQTRLRPYLEGISLSIEGDEFGLDFSQTTALFLDRIRTDPENGLIDFFEFNNSIGANLTAYGWAGWELLTEHLAGAELGEGALAVLREFAVLPVDTGQDALTGSNKPDTLIGSAGADRLLALGGDDRLIGGAGDDHLNGDSGHDTLSGGPGDDELYGFDGSDTYRFGPGHGQDWINEWWSRSHTDTIEFVAGIESSDIEVGRSGQTLVLAHKNGRDRVSVRNWYSDPRYRIERVVFADGSEWSGAEIHARGLEKHGTEGDDELRSASGGHTNWLFGEAGDDFLAGDQGRDILDGGAGADVLTANVGDDELRGGRGNDMMWGHVGSDTYVFELGDGADMIHDYDYGGDETDRVVFGKGIRAEHLWFSQTGDDLRIENLASEDSVTIEGWYRHARYRVERIELEQGSVLLAGQVHQLVEAMAAFDPAPGSENPLPEATRAALEPLITASWQPGG